MNCSVINGAIFEQHDHEGHIECYDRLRAIMNKLPGDLIVHPAVAATDADISRVHKPGYMEWLHNQCVKNIASNLVGEFGTAGGYFEQNTFVPGFLDSNTYVNPRSYEVATYAAGSAIAATDRARDGENCFALVRPPGHHAASDWAMGFCLLNNAAIAAAKALTYADRVAIIDWDVHHGNGTQDIFYGNDQVLYCSIHEDDVFPHTGKMEETGSGSAKGWNINAPLRRESKIGDYAFVFRELFLPALERVKPEVVIISSGQDGLFDDPVGNMALVPADFGYLTGLLLDTLDMPLAFVLEGGYGPSQPEAVVEIIEAVRGKRHKPAMQPESGDTRTRVLRMKKIHGM